VTSSEIFIPSDDSIQLFVKCWHPEASPRAVVHIVHGLAEHSLRYAPLAEFLSRHGIAVVTHDHRGHGRTANKGTLGLYSKHNGWQKVVADVGRVQDLVVETFPDAPIILLGHSMGSYVCQAYLMLPNIDQKLHAMLSGCILSGTNFGRLPLFRLLRQIARFECWRQGPEGRSKLIDLMSFGDFNKAFKPNRTKFDWLSQDEHQVDLYVNDPLCGQLSTNQLWLDLVDGLIEITQIENLTKLPSNLPIYIMGGEKDPVSAGNRLPLLAEAFKKAGLVSVDLKLYPGSRHEIFNEINREQVFQDLLKWVLTTGVPVNPSAK